MGSWACRRRSWTATLLGAGLSLVAGCKDPGPLSAGASMTTARSQHTATALPGDVIVLAGGLDSNGAALAALEVYRGGSFHAAGALSQPSLAHTATALSPWEVLIAGGQIDAAGQTLHDRTAIFDTGAGAARPGPPLAQPRSGHLALASTLGGRPVVAFLGGWTRTAGQGATALVSIEVLDAALLQLRTLPFSTLEAHIDGAAVELSPGRILMVGGYRDTARTRLAGVEVVDLGAGQAQPVADLATPRARMSLGWVQGQVVVAGGVDQAGQGLDGAEVHDAGSSTWGRAAWRLSTARSEARAAEMAGGALALVGGLAGGAAQAAVDVALPGASTTHTTRTWQLIAPRSGHTVTALAGGTRLLIAGGRDARGRTLADSEILDGLKAGLPGGPAPATAALPRGPGATPVILVTGFGPFAYHARNSSWEAASALDGRLLHGYRVVARLMPVSYRRVGPEMARAVGELHPAMVIGLGMGDRGGLAIETRATNLVDSSQRDEDGEERLGQPVVAGAPYTFDSRLPTTEMLGALQRKGYSGWLSPSAQGFLCNYIFYWLVHTYSLGPSPIPTGFVHTPPPDDPYGEQELADATLVIVEEAARWRAQQPGQPAPGP
ncbi:MAG: hypothetical protein HY722_04385 [Planctomycetes bacterium]|nr:hypothetical protein [Planctomycetota bacterium]